MTVSDIEIEPADLAGLDQAHALRPWTHFPTAERKAPLVISRGEGVWLWDSDGRRFLDAVGGLWCTNIGLGRREMAEAIAAQAEKLAFSNTFVDVTNEPSALLAAKLAEIAPEGITRAHFTTGGSTAIDSAYRLAQFAQAAMGRPERTHVIAREKSYHGSTYLSMSVGLRDGDRIPEFRYKTDTIHHVSAPLVVPGESDADATRRLVAEFEAKISEVGADRIAAFFAEPVQASGGVIVPPDGYIAAMHRVCRAHGILFVADEVVTGFGRLGHWFASSGLFGIVPDIICVAKGLSSGYQPIGAVLFSDDIWNAMSGGGEWFTHGFTYAGHPVACAAALKNIEIMEREDILENARTVGAYFQEQLRTLEALPLVKETRGLALIACVESRDVAGGAVSDEAVGKKIARAAQERGLMVRPMDRLNVMSPPLIVTRDEVDLIVETLDASIRAVADALVRDGGRIG